MYNVKVFSTYRKIREYIGNAPNGPLPKLFTINDFIENLVVVPGKIRIDNNLRVFYLHEAIKKLDNKKLSKLGIPENFYSFISFISKKDFFFKFFEELASEKTDITEIKNYDVYAEFDDHISIIEEILKNYKKILEENNYFDKITLEHYTLNTAFLDSINEITVHVDGYLTKFEREIFAQLKNIKLRIFATPYNYNFFNDLISDTDYNHYYLIDFLSKNIISKKPTATYKFSKLRIYKSSIRISQVAVVLKEIENMLKKGILPEKIVIILPKEDFIKYLKHFDKNSINGKRIFNFAMGYSFNETENFKDLEKFYKSGIADKIDSFETLIDFLKNYQIDNEEARLKFEEELFKFEKIYSNINLSINELFYIFLKTVENIKISDNSGGKITVMGVLESRGMVYDGVIIVDFNEGIVPHVSDKDIFLNTFIRKKAGLPTREHRENLQKHYFYTLLKNSKYKVITFVENDEQKPSRFINQLNLGAEIQSADNYIEAILPGSEIKPHYFEKKEIKDKNFIFQKKTVTPTMLKMYLECKRKFYFKYYKNLSYEEREEFNFGLILHDAIKNFAYIGVNKDEYFGNLWNYLLQKTISAQDKILLEIWKNRIENFAEIDSINLNKAKKIFSEKECMCRFADFTLKARVDRIEVYDDRVRLVDFKTTRSKNIPVRSNKLKTNINDFQLVFYYLIGKELFNNKNIEVAYISIEEPEKDYTVNVTEHIPILADILSNIPEKDIFEPNEKYCYFCDYKLLCGKNI